MKINNKLIENIFSLKLKLKKKEDKIKLSNYHEIIPMFDIYSLNIYPIKNINIHYRMIDSYYRFVNNEIIDWLKNMKKKLSKEIINKNLKIINRNLEIMNNYNIDILEKKSIETFFKYSPKFGLEISICKRNSFHPKLFHIKPYYSKTELIKLGQNMNLLEEINSQKLLDKEIHYKI